MIIIPFQPGEPWHAHRRRCRFAHQSLHVYRRALARRFGIPVGDRPAVILDNMARALLKARVA